MPPEAWAVVGVVIGSVLGGGAQIVAGALSDKSAHRRWLREQRVDAYRAVLLQADSSLRGLRVSEEKGDVELVPYDWDGGISERLPAIELFGSAEVAGRAWGLAQAFNGLGDTLPGIEDVTKQLKAAIEAREDYIAAVRADLGVE